MTTKNITINVTPHETSSGVDSVESSVGDVSIEISTQNYGGLPAKTLNSLIMQAGFLPKDFITITEETSFDVDAPISEELVFEESTAFDTDVPFAETLSITETISYYKSESTGYFLEDYTDDRYNGVPL